MTYATAARILNEPGYPEEERLYARRWMRQRQLFPGDARLMYGDCRPLQVPIREVILCRQHGRSA